MAEDYNSWNEVERRRAQFARWLLKAWEWALDSNRPKLAETIAEIHYRASEPDCPLWRLAEEAGVIGDGKIAGMLRKAFGVPVSGPVASSFERDINLAPVIYLDEPTWRLIHGSLGWVNRDHDGNINEPNFWLWSSAANQVRFIMRKPVAVTDPDPLAKDIDL
jgi:hypothetical protein